MFKLLLVALLGICSGCEEQYQVRMEYDSPHLSLLVPVTNADVTSVLFYFGMRNSPFTSRGSKAVDGWEYYHNFTANTDDVIYAYADIQYSTGLLVTTPHAEFTVF